MYKLILSIRYLLKRKISYFSIAAVALCVFVALIVITVLSGLTKDFKQKTHFAVGDCVVATKSLVGFGYYEDFLQILEKEKIVEAVSPVIKSYALVNVIVRSGMINVNSNETAEIMGIDVASHSKVTDFAKWIYYNKKNISNVFKPSYDPNLPGCVPGINYLFSRDSDGNYNISENLPEIKLEISSFPLTAKGALAKGGAGEVNTKTFYYSDYAHSGQAMFDWKRIYLPFADAQRICGMDTGPKRISAIHIKFKPKIAEEFGCDRIKQLWEKFVASKSGAKHANLLDNVIVQSWKTYSRELVSVAETQETMMILCFAMIGIITVFIVFVVSYMIVCHKTKDIGILKSIGISNINIQLVFLNFAFLMGILGSAIGAVCGWRFLVHINQIEDWMFKHFQFQLWDRTMFAIGDIPNTIDLKVLTWIILSAIIACLAGTLLPSRQAAKLKPVEILQVNQL